MYTVASLSPPSRRDSNPQATPIWAAYHNPSSHCSVSVSNRQAVEVPLQPQPSPSFVTRSRGVLSHPLTHVTMALVPSLQQVTSVSSLYARYPHLPNSLPKLSATGKVLYSRKPARDCFWMLAEDVRLVCHRQRTFFTFFF